jgi:hypothetical protein
MKRDAYGQLNVNSYPLIYPVGPVAPLTPWAMNLADEQGTFWLLCFDFDGKDNQGTVDAELMERAADQCDALARVLDELGIAYVVCESSGTGGRHLWIAINDGATPEQIQNISSPASVAYNRLDFGMLNNPATGSARPPGSPHRDGSFSRILTGSVAALAFPTNTAADLARLAEVLEERKPALVQHDGPPSGPVDPEYVAQQQHALPSSRSISAAGAAHMATINGGADPSWTGFMCLLSAAAAGWTFADVERAALTAPGLEHYRTRRADADSGTSTTSRSTARTAKRRPRSSSDTHARLERQWRAAEKRVALHRPVAAQTSTHEPDDLVELSTIVSTVADLLERFEVSPGKWGQSESASNRQTILRAVMYLTLRTGKVTVAAGTRALGLMTGLGRTTACVALPALAKAGYLERVTVSENGNAAEWRLISTLSTGSRTVRSQPLSTARPPAGPINIAHLFNTRALLLARLENELTDQRHDVFTRPALGHLAGKLYALFAQHVSLTVETAAHCLGVSLRHTTTIVSRLTHHKLIVGHTASRESQTSASSTHCASRTKSKNTNSVQSWARATSPTRKKHIDIRDRAARILGVDGLLRDRAARYQVEQEVWAWWQAELAVMLSSPRNRPRRPHVTARSLISSTKPGERNWPRYPRDDNNLAEHRVARRLVAAGHLNPESRWQYLGDAA